jgi:site-specific recombinase XerD
MRRAGERPHGLRIRGLIVVLWRAGLRISEALALNESDLEPAQGSMLVRSGKGGRRRVVGMDEWGWAQLRPWLAYRCRLPVGALFCVINPPSCGTPWSSSAVRVRFRALARQAGVTRRFAPHQLRHAHAVEMAREGIDGCHAEVGVPKLALDHIERYLQGIDIAEIVEIARARRDPVIPAAAALVPHV